MSTRYLVNGQTHRDLPKGHHLSGETAPGQASHDADEPGRFSDVLYVLGMLWPQLVAVVMLNLIAFTTLKAALTYMFS